MTPQRVWFAEPLLSGATDEIRPLLVRAKQIAEPLNLKVVLWISDKQAAFLQCLATEFPDTPHRDCENHFFRDLAQPVLEIDRTAKKNMRAKIRGLRALEREVLQARSSRCQRHPFSAGQCGTDVAAGWRGWPGGSRLLECGT